MKRDTEFPNYQRRAIGAIAAIAAGAGIVLGEPMKEAAGSALSIFNLCQNDDALSRDVDLNMSRQKDIVKTIQPVQNKNDKNFYLHRKQDKRCTRKHSKTERWRDTKIQTNRIIF